MVGVLQEQWLTVGYYHEHISPIWSASVAILGRALPAIATPYYGNGNIVNYVRLHPSANRLDLVRQTASALAHIHSKDVIHGDVCPVSLPRMFLDFGGTVANNRPCRKIYSSLTMAQFE
jgi:hypothetical protein